MPVQEAGRVFAMVSQSQPLPDGFVPPDLVRLGGVPRVLGQPVSAVVMPDLESMVAQAQMDNVDIAVLSAYRSFSEQEIIFEQNVQRSMYRTGVMLSREEAERAAERFSPGLVIRSTSSEQPSTSRRGKSATAWELVSPKQTPGNGSSSIAGNSDSSSPTPMRRSREVGIATSRGTCAGWVASSPRSCTPTAI